MTDKLRKRGRPRKVDLTPADGAIGTPKTTFAYPARAGYFRRWFDDKPGNVAEAAANGYEHVTEDDGRVCRVNGKNPGGDVCLSYLMEKEMSEIVEAPSAEDGPIARAEAAVAAETAEAEGDTA